MTTLNDFTTGRCWKNVCLAFSVEHISFSKNLDYAAYAKF